MDGDHYFSIHCLSCCSPPPLPPSPCCCLYCPHFPHLAPLPLSLPPPSYLHSLGSILCWLQPSRQPLHRGRERSLHNLTGSLVFSDLSRPYSQRKSIFQQKSHCPLHRWLCIVCLLTLSQMANLYDLVIISLNQAATFGLEVVLHSQAAALQSQPLERLKKWHQDISIMQRFHPFFPLLLL